MPPLVIHLTLGRGHKEDIYDKALCHTGTYTLLRMAKSSSSTPSPFDETTAANTYRLNCTDCPFETTIREDSDDVIDVVEAHREEYRTTLTDHFVNFAVVDQQST